MSWLTGHPPSATTASKVGQRPGVGRPTWPSAPTRCSAAS